jgi:hypothetical protein
MKVRKMSEESRQSKRRSTIQEVRRRLSRALLQHPGVEGVGIEAAAGGGEQIKVYLREDTPELRSLVPPTVEEYPVVVEAIGRISPRTK